MATTRTATARPSVRKTAPAPAPKRASVQATPAPAVPARGRAKAPAPTKAAPAPAPAKAPAPTKAAPAPAKAAPAPAKAAPARRAAPPTVARPAVPAPVRKAPAPAGPTAREKELAADVEKLTRMIETLKARLAKAEKSQRRNVRTVAEILDGAPELPANDWRNAYQGVIVPLYAGHYDKEAGAFVPDGSGNVLDCLLAIPRDSDVGGKGPTARREGLIAVHDQLCEDGESYLGAPVYLRAEDLAALWADGADGADGAEEYEGEEYEGEEYEGEEYEGGE